VNVGNKPKMIKPNCQGKDCKEKLPGTKDYYDTYGNFCKDCDRVIENMAKSRRSQKVIEKVEETFGVKDDEPKSDNS